MFECRICCKNLKKYTIRGVGSHFATSKCLKVANDIWYERDYYLEKMENGDDSKYTLETYNMYTKLFNSYRDFKTNTLKELREAKRVGNKNPKQYEYLNVVNPQ